MIKGFGFNVNNISFEFHNVGVYMNVHVCTAVENWSKRKTIRLNTKPQCWAKTAKSYKDMMMEDRGHI